MPPTRSNAEGELELGIIVERDDFASLVSPDAELSLLASGYVFTEGPVWNVVEQALYYSDIPDDRRYRWTEAGRSRAGDVPDVQGQRDGLRRRPAAHRVRARLRPRSRGSTPTASTRWCASTPVAST